MINSIHFLLFFLPKSNLIMHLIFFDDIRSSMPSRFLHHYELFIMKTYILQLCQLRHLILKDLPTWTGRKLKFCE
ncbi:hypothetical protein HanIR_Chr04g0204591 [Helianthus annuus]|nr:hypothetical protein HanIR_Chr04g0204591 [Helianthus annuus]